MVADLNFAFETLQTSLEGDIYRDLHHRSAYATDASLYEIIPQFVARPRTVEDIKKILLFCNEYSIPVTPRGTGTSLAGQTVGSGLVLDMNKYQNQIIEINAEENYAIVQPGVYRDTLNAACKKHNLHFAPDPATSNRASIGGMIANNSSGTRSILYGKTSDHLISLDILMIDGREICLDKRSSENPGNDDYASMIEKIRPLIFNNTAEIESKYPKVMRRVSGYALDSLLKEDWNLSQLICGSEGTLAIITRAKIKLTPLPKFTSLHVLQFGTRSAAIRSVELINKTDPAAVELLDFHVLEASRNNPITKEYHDQIITGNPSAVLFVEHFGNNHEELDIKAEKLLEILNNINEINNIYNTYDKVIINNSLQLRKDGLGILMNKISDTKPIPFIEDSAIPLKFLPEYVDSIERYCQAFGTEIVLYAHASVGVLHIRPYLDLTKDEDVKKMENISAFALMWVKQYGGSWSGEHGDGRVRSYALKKYFGDEIYEIWKSIKSIFDPKNLLNPGVILDAESITENLRTKPTDKYLHIDTIYQYKKEKSFPDLINKCSGIGACVKHNVGTMCPSYMATSDESNSPRGRANVLRMAIKGQFDNKNITISELDHAMELCLSCKACKTECPSNVDIAKLKSEYLHQSHTKRGVKPMEWFTKHASDISAFSSGKMAGLINRILRLRITKLILEKTIGIDRRRSLPEYSKTNFAEWYAEHYQPKNRRKVALFCDTYLNFHEPEIGIAAIDILEKAGYDVELADVGCCQRPKISNGFLCDAKSEGRKTLESLKKYTDQGIQIVVCEPSCTSALIDDLPDLIDEEWVANVTNHIHPIDQFIKQGISEGTIDKKISYKNDKTLYHAHCHAQSEWKDHSFLTKDGKETETLDLGCCGMAGSFGYEKKKFEISKKVFENRILPVSELLDKNATVCSNGFSCRHQFKDFGNHQVVHWLQAIELI